MDIVHTNFHISFLLTITTAISIFERRVFFADFFQFVKFCMLLVNTKIVVIAIDGQLSETMSVKQFSTNFDIYYDMVHQIIGSGG